MSMRLVGVSYNKPSLRNVSYVLPKVRDVDLIENLTILYLNDSATAQDFFRTVSDIGIKDSAEAFSQCLYAKPPHMDEVDVQDVLTINTRYSRSFRDSIVPNSSIVFGVDKHLKDVAVTGDKVHFEFEKVLDEELNHNENFSSVSSVFLNNLDVADVDDSLRFTMEKNLDEQLSILETLRKQFDDGGFSDSSSASDGFALSFAKKLIDNVSVTDFITVLWARNAGSMYGQSTYGSATFGG